MMSKEYTASGWVKPSFVASPPGESSLNEDCAALGSRSRNEPKFCRQTLMN